VNNLLLAPIVKLGPYPEIWYCL